MNPNSSPASSSRLFSIGHSNHEPEQFVRLLRGAGITAVADVRSQPFSQRYPQYSQPALQRWLGDHDIAYAFLGEQLGGRPRSPQLYDGEGRVNYERVRQTAAFQEGLNRLVEGSDHLIITMLCSEEDPLHCHRGLMIAPALVERGVRPAHVRGDGSIESMEQVEERLLSETKVGQGIVDGMFATMLSEEERRQLLAEAYRVQALRKAFRLKPEGFTVGVSLQREEELA